MPVEKVPGATFEANLAHTYTPLALQHGALLPETGERLSSKQVTVM